MSLLMFILHVEDDRVRCLYKGNEYNCTPAEDLDVDKLPLNGLALVETYDGVNYVVGSKKCSPTQSMLIASKGAAL